MRSFLNKVMPAAAAVPPKSSAADAAAAGELLSRAENKLHQLRTGNTQNFPALNEATRLGKNETLFLTCHLNCLLHSWLGRGPSFLLSNHWTLATVILCPDAFGRFEMKWVEYTIKIIHVALLTHRGRRGYSAQAVLVVQYPT